MFNFATIAMSALNNAQAANRIANDVRPVNDKQWETYTRIARQKYVPLADRATFTMSTISQEMNKLIQLPNAYRASQPQVKRYTDLCAQLNIKAQDTKSWSNIFISERIEAMMNLVPPSAGQIQYLFNYYRFGIIGDLAENMSQAKASAILKEHEEDYRIISEGMATIAQVAKIQELEAKALGYEFDRSRVEYVDQNAAVRVNYAMKVMLLQNEAGNITNVIELSKLSFEDASLRIEKLEAERQAMRDILKSTTSAHEGMDRSRSADMEEINNMFDCDKDFAGALNAYHAIKRELGQQWDEDDANLNEQNMGDAMESIMKVALACGVDGKRLYAIVASNTAEPTVAVAPRTSTPRVRAPRASRNRATATA